MSIIKCILYKEREMEIDLCIYHGIEDKRIKQTLKLIKVLPADDKNGQIYSIQQLIVPFDVLFLFFYYFEKRNEIEIRE